MRVYKEIEKFVNRILLNKFEIIKPIGMQVLSEKVEMAPRSMKVLKEFFYREIVRLGKEARTREANQ